MRRYNVQITVDAPRLRKEWTTVRHAIAKEIRVRHIARFESNEVGVGVMWWSPNRDTGQRRIFRLWRQIVFALVQQNVLDPDSHIYPLTSRYVHSDSTITPTAIITIEEGVLCPYPSPPAETSASSARTSGRPTPPSASSDTWQPSLVTPPEEP